MYYIFVMCFLVLLVIMTLIAKLWVFCLAGAVVSAAFLYVRPRWIETNACHKRFMVSTGFPFLVYCVTIVPLASGVLLLSHHPLLVLCGRGATAFTLLWYHLQGLSLYYGFFAIIGIIDQAIGFLWKRPLAEPPLISNLLFGPVFLTAGIMLSIQGAVYGLPGHPFSPEFLVRYLAIMHRSLRLWGWNSGWPFAHYAVVCGPPWILIGVWRTLAGLETVFGVTTPEPNRAWF